jgi:hypothetical protein
VKKFELLLADAVGKLAEMKDDDDMKGLQAVCAEDLEYQLSAAKEKFAEADQCYNIMVTRIQDLICNM